MSDPRPKIAKPGRKSAATTRSARSTSWPYRGPYEVNVVSGGAPGVSATGRLQPARRNRGGGRERDAEDPARRSGAASTSTGTTARRCSRSTPQRCMAPRSPDRAGSMSTRSRATSTATLRDRATSSWHPSPAARSSSTSPVRAAIDAAGKADGVDLSIAGSGDIRAGGLASRTADVSIAGSGNVAANASDTAAVSIMGSGDVDISGGAKCSVSKAGSGDVRCS